MALETNAHRSALHSSGFVVWVRNPHNADRAFKKQKPTDGPESQKRLSRSAFQIGRACGLWL